MGMVEFAERELRIAGFDPDGEDGPTKWTYDNVMELTRTFVGQGHSGSSAPMILEIFRRVASYEALTPLTGADDEWTDLGNGLFQNKRCFSVFKQDGDAYDDAGIVFRHSDGRCYTSKNSRVPVTFPYVHKRMYQDVGDEKA